MCHHSDDHDTAAIARRTGALGTLSTFIVKLLGYRVPPDARGVMPAKAEIRAKVAVETAALGHRRSRRNKFSWITQYRENGAVARSDHVRRKCDTRSMLTQDGRAPEIAM